MDEKIYKQSLYNVSSTASDTFFLLEIMTYKGNQLRNIQETYAIKFVLISPGACNQKKGLSECNW